MLDEALELRNAGISEPILILGYTSGRFADIVVDSDIRQVCYSYELAKDMSEAAVKLNKTGKVHIAVDTGMGRVGLQPTPESADLVEKISKLPNLEVEGLFTHFAAADEADKEYTYWQYERYNSFLKMLSDRNVDIKYKHVGNSAALIDLPGIRMDAVRPGIIQYGLYPSEAVDKSKIDLKPVMSVKANIIHVKEVDEGTSISYGRRFITNRRSRVATLPVGYADGYSRLLFGKASVIINGKLAPVIGTICMDQCMVDVTDAGDVKVGDEAVIMGGQGGAAISAEDIASHIGTINYEVICMFSKRVPRVYIKDGKVVNIKNYLLK
jgi:alanine racemase